MNESIKPVGLKGRQVTERMKELMGIPVLRESINRSVIEITKVGPDNKVYGVLRENHKFFIKVAPKKSNLIAEDFQYIGGLKNKMDFSYPSYSKAVKQLSLKLNSLYEAYGVVGNINAFKKDDVSESISFQSIGGMSLQETSMSKCCGATIQEDKCTECGKSIMEENEVKNNPWAICTSKVGRGDKKKYEACVRDVKKENGIDETMTEEQFHGVSLSEANKVIQDMMESKARILKTPKLTIENSLQNLDAIIDELAPKSKKKVYSVI